MADICSNPSPIPISVPTSTFKELTVGNMADGFKHKKVSHLCQNSNQCFSVTFTNGSKPLYLVADSEETAGLWITGIQCFIRLRQSGELVSPHHSVAQGCSNWLDFHLVGRIVLII